MLSDSLFNVSIVKRSEVPKKGTLCLVSVLTCNIVTNI